MPITVWFARMIGADFPCHLVEHMRTTVYKIPVLKVKEPKPAACIIFDEPGFRASVVVDPFTYLRDESISGQFEFQDNFKAELSEACPSPVPDSEAPLYVVLQFKEDLDAFPAVDGQCRKIYVAGVERLLLFECGQPYTPNPNERNRTINAVLTAIRGEFAVTGGMEPCFNRRCYRTDDGQCVLLSRENPREPTVQLTRSIDATQVTNRATAAAALVTQIEKSMQASHGGAQMGRGSNFGVCLEELIEALQLDETEEHKYWRLWYLQLFDRLETFGKQCQPALQLGNQEGLKDEYCHRNLIAHRGVDRIDGQMLRSIQLKAIDIIRRKT